MTWGFLNDSLIIKNKYKRNLRQTYQKNCLKAKKMENNDKGLDSLNIILLIHVYALAEIRQVK